MTSWHSCHLLSLLLFSKHKDSRLAKTPYGVCVCVCEGTSVWWLPLQVLNLMTDS